ncbi:hypothetical protein KKG52_01120 [Patescibacteria group bacterium]|nr:hypothetical protein [Patescibacteria group bacterium]
MNTKKGLIFILFFFILALASDKNANAASLISISDTISTSRPSASTPLNGVASAGSTSITVFDNKSVFLASDSARLWGGTAETVTVASSSADLTKVYLTSATANVHTAGSMVTSAITAMHKVQFTTVNAIPISGKIVLTFPGSADNTASPSATTFAFNGLTSANVKINAGSTTCSWGISSPSITCTTGAAVVSAGSTITVLIGCSANTGATCDTQVPTLINPAKSTTSGTADKWKVNISTQDTGSVELDSGSAAVGTIESVLVTATVDPTLNFTIQGRTTGQAVNTGNATGCTNTETLNTGISSLSTSINMGVLSESGINISAQLISISTNGLNGYSLTATSSGQLINPENGFWINSSTTPGFITAGTPWFGLHPCGLDISSGTWGTGATGGGAGAKYAWPTKTTSVTLASDSTGPIANSLLAGNGLTTVEYAATIDASVPAGSYRSIVTYVATPSF